MRWAVWLWALGLWACTAMAAAPPSIEGLRSILTKANPSELIPGADRFGPIRESPVVASAYRGQTLVGHVYLNSDYADATGYSGQPIHILIGLDLEGTIVGIKLVQHSEPIVVIGIPELKVSAHLQAFVGYNPIQSAAAGRGSPHPDLVSGATVTALVMGESVVRSAVRVTRALQGNATPGAVVEPARVFNAEVDAPADWKSLVKGGEVRRVHITVAQINKAFEDSGNVEAAMRPEIGPKDSTFSELYAALISHPAIGRRILGDEQYARVAQRLEPGQHAILAAGNGPYSFRAGGEVRGGIFDRIQLVQGAESIRFKEEEYVRLASLAAAGAPDMNELAVFLIPPGATFDPLAPWRLQLLVQRPAGGNETAFVSFDLPYQLPQRYTKLAPVASGQSVAASRDQPSADGPRATEVPAGAFSVESAEQPLWQRMWYSRIAAIVVLSLMLAALTFIFFFQDFLLRREALFERIRLTYLAIVLLWLGWVAQAQLSVVNVLTFTTALRTGFQWSAFLVDPLVFILWSSVAVALLFWGRGPFCGWLCPFGALQELANRGAKALKVPQLKIPWRVHERLWPFKYIIFLVLFGVSLGSLTYAEKLAEIEPFKTAIVLRFVREWWFVTFAVALIVAGLFVERFFCRYLCPLGAALAIPGRIRMFDWLKRYRECGNPCLRCFKECPVEAIHPEGHINPNECISCLHCQVLYHHDHKCPVLIQRRLKRERRSAMAPAPLGGETPTQT